MRHFFTTVLLITLFDVFEFCKISTDASRLLRYVVVVPVNSLFERQLRIGREEVFVKLRIVEFD